MATAYDLIVTVEDANDKPITGVLAVDTEARKEIAARLNLLTLDKFKFTYRLEPGVETGTYRFDGRIQVSCAQRCVVTLLPVGEKIDRSFSVHLMADPGEDADDTSAGLDLDLEDEGDDVEYHVRGKANIGEIAVQYLSVNLESYPRHKSADEAAQLAPSIVTEEEAPRRASPFAVLKGLTDKG